MVENVYFLNKMPIDIVKTTIVDKNLLNGVLNFSQILIIIEIKKYFNLNNRRPSYKNYNNYYKRYHKIK